ncbi:hypothetical protein PN36_24370, partial [Candidatus Thiomargarita nelsonii]
KMQYPLTEKIGHPDLLVGRQNDFRKFDKWLSLIPMRMSKSRVILARRKSGKTAFVQRIFNRLWSENGAIIPFYFDFAEKDIWYPDFAIGYFCTFVSHYISFIERNDKWVNKPMLLEDILEYGLANSNSLLVDEVKSFHQNKKDGLHDAMWERAYSAPHRFAALLDTRFLVILDEFQNITQYVYRRENGEGKPIESLAGSFHYHSESKIAPMLVTGSYVGWLLNVIGKYLEAGRLKHTSMSPYLTLDEGLEAVYKYAEFCQETIIDETAVLINRLCMADPFFISCVIQSDYEKKDLTTLDGVVDTVDYEISDRQSEMSKTWNEYIQLTLQRVDDNRDAKNMLLHLSKYTERDWTPQELKEELQLDIDINEIQKKLVILSEADVIERGIADIDFRGLRDGTLNLILRNRFEKEIEGSAPELKQDFRDKIAVLKAKEQKLQGKLNQLSGKMAEHLLAIAFRRHRYFKLSDFFQDVLDMARLNIVEVRERVIIQRDDGKNMELDVVAKSKCGRVILVEVKNTTDKIGLNLVETFQEKVEVYGKLFPDKKILPAFLSLAGFHTDAIKYCQVQGIGTADEIPM